MTKGATIRATKDVKPRRPKVDRGEEVEQLVRQLYKPAVDRWCKDNLKDMPPSDVRGNVVDNLTASFTSTIETLVDSSTDSYLSTSDEDDEDVVECPKCSEDFELPDGADEGDDVTCPHCKHEFEVPPVEEVAEA